MKKSTSQTKPKKHEKTKKISFDILLQSLFTQIKYTLHNNNPEPNYYHTPPPTNTPPILMIAIITFHHKKGSVVEFTYPSKEELLSPQNNSLPSLDNKLLPSKVLDILLNQLTFYCLPDGCHLINEDNQFFIIQHFNYLLYCVSCYKQTKYSIEDEQENTRNCVQKAMCIVSKFPLFGHYYSKLSLTIEAFFSQHTLKDKEIVSQLYQSCRNISFNNLNKNELYLTFSLRKLLLFTKDKLWLLIKLILLEKKILIFGKRASDVCSFIITLLSIFPGSLLFNLEIGKEIEYFRKSLNMYGLPLKIFHNKYKLFPLISLHEIEDIDSKCESYVIGTTNQIITKMNKLKIDCLVEIDSQKITLNETNCTLNEKVFKHSKKEKKILTLIQTKLKDINIKYEQDNWISDLNINTNNDFGRTDDYLIKLLQNYFYEFLINIALAIKITKNANEEIYKSIELIKIEDIADSGDENESISDKFKNKILKENEKIAKQTITKILHDYNKDFIFNWLQTQNCKTWLHEHDKNLGYKSEYVKHANDVTIYYENGDVYNGSLKMGKRNGNGSYREISTKRVYNGEWVNDERNGIGSLTSEDLQYIYDGEWKNGMMNGNGQLIDKKSKYSGTFVK